MKKKPNIFEAKFFHFWKKQCFSFYKSHYFHSLTERYLNYVHESGDKSVKSIDIILMKLNSNWELFNIT